jgi:hypothetical protein
MSTHGGSKDSDRSIGELFRIIIVMKRRGFVQESPDTDRYTDVYKVLGLAHRATPAQHLDAIIGCENRPIVPSGRAECRAAYGRLRGKSCCTRV